MFHYHAVSADLLSVLRRLMQQPLLQGFRLAGGTSLALQLGHRLSVDIDLFTDTAFDKKAVQNLLAETFSSYQFLWQNDNGFSALVNDVKLDLFNWRVRFAEPAVVDDTFRLYSKKEIAAMKLEAITDRKTKKDFSDLYFLLKEYRLAELIALFRTKYPFMDHRFPVECLSTAAEANETDLPTMLVRFDWEEAKAFLTQTANAYVDELQGQAAALQADRIKRAEELLRKKKEDN